jgi:ribonuclease P protein component
MEKQFTLGKIERLKSRKLIEQLFSQGKKITVSPFRVYYLHNESSTPPLQFGIGVSNKNFKRAVDRNRIKRSGREAWRLQKAILQQKLIEQNTQLNIFLIYTGKELPEYKDVYAVINKILNRLAVIIEPSK